MRNDLRVPAAVMGGNSKVMGTVPFFYNFNVSSIAAAASSSGVINVQADAAFAWDRMTVTADLAQAAQTDSGRVIPLCTIVITDTGSGRQFMDAATPLPAIMGDGRLPYVLPVVSWWAPSTSISLAIVNYSAGSTYSLRITFHGTKVFMGR